MNILGLGLPELIVIAIVLLLFFGANRLPGLFRAIGTSINELKSGLNEGEKITSQNETDSSPNTSTPVSDSGVTSSNESSTPNRTDTR